MHVFDVVGYIRAVMSSMQGVHFFSLYDFYGQLASVCSILPTLTVLFSFTYFSQQGKPAEYKHYVQCTLLMSS